MVRPSACHSSCQNFSPIGENELAGPALTEGSDTYILASAVSRPPTPALQAALAPAFAPAVVNSMVKYLEADFQRIFRTTLKTRPPAPTFQPLVFPDGPCKRLLKARFPKLYCVKTHVECHNFIQQCEDHFATAKAKKPNRVFFAATFVQKQALFYWQQYKAKNAGKTDILLTWEKFKAFFCRNLGESQVFVDSIWKTIRRDSQYQQEEIMDWAIDLEHLQTVLKKFDSAASPIEEVLIDWFCDSLRPSIQAQTDKQGQDKDIWEESIKKAMDTETKAAHQP